MPDSASSSLATADEREDLSNLFTEKPTIRILIYTDDPEVTDDRKNFFSLGTMIAHIKAHKPTFADLDIKIICRNSSRKIHADNKLDEATLDEYDEVWVFGFHQANRKKFTLGILRGGPESELVEEEILALRTWMCVDKKGGGVLITGDHSQEPPPDAQPGTNHLCADDSARALFLGLGRAIGRCVPRAGRLRKWKGEPTNRKEDSFNTEVSVPGIDVDSLLLQIDPIPQQLVLKHFNQEGKAAPGGQPHPLFFYKDNRLIRVFPDHAHEGAVVLPRKDEFDDKETWPEGKPVQPKPQVVAFGVDERHCRLRRLLAVYNGDSARVGRIVADSTWHHYLNINLTNFDSPALAGSAADQIGQYYGNLALWLSPYSKRQKMASLMYGWLATHPLMMEEIYGDVLSIGSVAYSLLTQVASPCEIHELIEAHVPDYYREKVEAFYFPERGQAYSHLPSKELILGCVINRYQQEIIRLESADGFNEENFTEKTVIAEGFKNAFEMQAGLIMEIALQAKELCGL